MQYIHSDLLLMFPFFLPLGVIFLALLHVCVALSLQFLKIGVTLS